MPYITKSKVKQASEKVKTLNEFKGLGKVIFLEKINIVKLFLWDFTVRFATEQFCKAFPIQVLKEFFCRGIAMIKVFTLSL